VQFALFEVGVFVVVGGVCAVVFSVRGLSVGRGRRKCGCW
jgi:hypothetical protein